MRIETPRQMGALLKDGRRKAGLTQRDLAERIQASTRWVQWAEHGAAGTSMGMLLRALAAVGVSLEVAPHERQGAVPEIVVPDVDAIIARAKGPKARDREER